MVFVQYLENCENELKNLHCEDIGYQILRNKTKTFCFSIQSLKAPAANILKQEALAAGADFALPKDAILYQREFYNGILMLNLSQSKALLKKLKLQPFGLKQVAQDLESHLKFHHFKPKIMGIINATPDSFYQDSRKNAQEAKLRILEMIQEGVEIIDIGAASTRPGSAWVSEEEEKARLKEILDFIKQEKINEKITLSIDTYTPNVARMCLDCGFHLINDITGFTKKEMIEAVRGYDCECVVMHMQGNPKEMQNNPHYQNLFVEIDRFFKTQIEALEKSGISKIILDIGIGFGKTLEHNLALIKHLGHFSHFGYPLLVGASRKSLIDKITPCSVEERLSGTLTIHLESLKNGASIIRCHDTKEHIQALKTWLALQEAKLDIPSQEVI